MRLDKFIAHASALSRKEVKIALKNGSVSVDGVCIRDGSLKLTGAESVTHQGDTLSLTGAIYLMLNKPKGYVCTHDDPKHPSVFELVASKHTLQVAGRLDVDTTGLVLLTNDGQWNHRVTSPHSGKQKLYRVTTSEPINQHQINELKAGIQLRGETKACLSAKVTLSAPCTALLSIQEGKYHQVKRMFAALGNHVVELERLAIADIHLDSELGVGEYRALTTAEIDCIQ